MAEALRAAGFPLLASKLSGETIEEASSEANPTNWGPDDARIIFTAYFEGTANVVERRTTQIGLFHELDRGIDVGGDATSAAQAARTARENGRRSRPLRFKMGVDGCGHEHGLAGVVFAFGLRGQCERLAACVRAVRGVLGEPKTQLNIVGLSRGAVAALAVAEMLGATPSLFVGESAELPSLNSQNSSDDGASTPPSSSGSLNILADSPRVPDSDPRPRAESITDAVHYPSPAVDDEVVKADPRSLARRTLRLHLLLFDPVPGNQVYTTRYLDPLHWSTGNQAMDVSSCSELRRVLAIYPYEPLPAITFHAPLIPTYPSTASVDEIASLGCHQGALLCAPNRISCRLSYAMLRSFLANECGVKLRGCRPFDESLATRQATLRVLEMLRAAAVDDAAKAGTFDGTYVSRAAHSPKPGAAVVRRATGRYLNAFHRRLATREGASTDVDDGRPLYVLDVVRGDS